METTLKAGMVLDSGFEILETRDLAELKAVGIWARHRKSGVQVFHILNDDEENLFGFTFATIPEDSAGEAHILEHSVLCGSEHYPLKDAFLVLAQGSLQTYLNAWTFPDKTIYPASSVNERDYFNLMAVYGDAVFRPLLSEWTFMQEGHRLEFSPKGENSNFEFPDSGNSSNGSEGALQITGVVYNEMKGAYSSLDAYAGLWSVKAVLPDTPYALESGGDPECIPELTWEGLREFHRTRYAPANCRVFLAGNIPTEKQLAFLEERFFSSLPGGTAAPPIPRAERWTAPRDIRVPCPAGSEGKATVLLSWLCGESTDTGETMAIGALAEILMGHDGSPLTRLLIESGLGEDLAPAAGLEGDLRETVFTVGLRGVELQGNTGKQVEALILGELRRLADEGIPPEEIEAILLTMEFANREIRRSGGPYSLVWLRRSLRGWLYGGKPWDSLLFVPDFTEIKRHLAENSRYFESLIQKYLLNNPHRAYITVEPEEGYLEKKEAELAKGLAQREAALSAEEKREIREKSAALEQIQGAADSPEALATVPHLSRRDLSADIEVIPREFRDAGGPPVLLHESFTNGISYASFAFPVDVLDPEDYLWLPFFTRVSTSLGLPGMDYGEVSGLLARTTGGFYASLQNGSSAAGTSRSAVTPSGILDLTGRDWLVFQIKALDEKIEPALDLALKIITQADFSDQRRIRDLLLEMKNEIDSSLAPSGHYYAGLRSSRYFSRARGITEIWGGLTQLEFVHSLVTGDIAEVIRRLCRIRDALISRAGLIVNLIGSAGAMQNALCGIESRFSRFGVPRPRNPAVEGEGAFHSFLKGSADTPEVFLSPALQVGFAALTIPGAPYTSVDHAAELVLAHQLSTGFLWEDIRMKGGAYGAFAQSDGLEGSFAFSTYRDPNPLRSVDAFAACLNASAARKPGDEALEKAIIGCFAGETRPRTGADKGFADFLRFLYGIEHGYREKRLRDLIAVAPDQIIEAARRLAVLPESASPIILAGRDLAEKAAAKLGVAVKELPV